MRHFVVLALLAAAFAAPCRSQSSIQVRDCFFRGHLSVQIVNGEPLVYLISTGGWVAQWVGGSQQGPRTWSRFDPGVQLLPLRAWTFNSRPCMVGGTLYSQGNRENHFGVLAHFDHVGWQEHRASAAPLPPGYTDIEMIEPGTCLVHDGGAQRFVGVCGAPCGPGFMPPDILVIEARVRFN